MNKPRIFLGSSGKQAKLLQAITRGLEDVADVEPWTTTFNPGRSTLDRLVELSQEVDFAAFVFAQDDWTTTDASQSGQASPRDNVVFEAGRSVSSERPRAYVSGTHSAPVPIVRAARPRAVSIPSRCLVTGRPGGGPDGCVGSDGASSAKRSRNGCSPSPSAGSAGKYSCAASG